MDDSYNFVPDERQNLDVLANDLQQAGSALDLSTLSIVTFPAQDVDAEFEIRNNLIRYQAAPDYVGTDSFTYSICNLDGECDIATVDIDVRPYSPSDNFCTGFTDTTIRFADNGRRDDSSPLDGQGFFTLNVQLPIYIFATVPDGTKSVKFYLDDTDRSGEPTNDEFHCTYDMRNPDNEDRRRFEFADFGTGFHSVTVEVIAADDSVSVTTAFFGVLAIDL